MNILLRCVGYCRKGSVSLKGEVQPFDLRGVTPGSRLASWLAGRTCYVWMDGWIGRLVLRLARVLSPRTRAAWPGPIMSANVWGVPLLSWFSVPADGDIAQAFISSLDSLLGEHRDDTDDRDDTAGLPPQTVALMQGLLWASFVCAGEASDGCVETQSCTRNLMHAVACNRKQQLHVVLIDERARVQQPGAVSPGSRREAFDRMVAAARAAHGDGTFWLLRSAQPGSGRWLSSTCRVLPPDIRTIPLGVQEPGGVGHAAFQTKSHTGTSARLASADHVYTVSAPEGLYAVLAGIRVNVFGNPYYAGWGLTQDDCPLPGRHARPTQAAFFHAVFIRLAHYLDPVTHQPGDLASVLASLALQQDVKVRFAGLRDVTAVGFSWWKRPFVTPFLMAGGGSLRWTNRSRPLERSESVALWGAREAPALPPDARCVRIEDGFFHSAGLGSDIVAPHSQVIDFQGIYFDATGPSDLTALLNEATFDVGELRRANTLRQAIVRLGLTKYNLGRRGPDWTAPGGRQVILVPGQVADDASVRLGSGGIATCEALLREVRKRRPHAWLVYRPHPDVFSGNRTGLVDAGRLADVVDTSADIVSLIAIADEVHTLSSLAGFDALLRGNKVFTYGLPFYAGWGLTHDSIVQIPRRDRKLSLDMLTAGALLRYPLYWDWRLRLYTTPEAVIRRLAHDAARPLRPTRRTAVRPVLRALRWARNVTLHASWHARQGFSRARRRVLDHVSI